METNIQAQAFSLILFGFLLISGMPQNIYAHSGSSDGVDGSSGMMMQEIEDDLVGDETHEEMEELMGKMMAGSTLTESEITRMTELMRDNQIVGTMMMGRMMHSGATQENTWTNRHQRQMTQFHSGGYMIAWWLFGILSFIFLLLANIALYKRITSKK